MFSSSISSNYTSKTLAEDIFGFEKSTQIETICLLFFIINSNQVHIASRFTK